MFHSPLTNTIAYTNTGGYAGTALKLAGFDGFTVSGRSSRPKYILVKKGEITLVDCDWLWGKRATDTMNALREKHGDVRVLSIGPAGENMVRYANVVNDSGRASGVRHGVGCLLGGMKLKAIAISSDYGLRLPVADKDRFRELLVKLNKKIQNSPLLNRDTGSFSIYGTPLAVEPLIQNEALPVKNYSSSPSYEGNLNLTGKKMSETILINRLTCNSCPVQCRRETGNVSKYTNFRVEGPDYAQISSLGSNCGLENLEDVAYLNFLCYELGLDPIETGNLLAIYAEGIQSGKVKPQSIALRWNDPGGMIKLVELIAQRKGDGAILAEGADALIESLGDDNLSTSVKGITIQNTDPRVEPAWGLLNATENSGASIHIWVYPDLIYSFRKIPGLKSLLQNEPEDPTQLARQVIQKQNQVAVFDSLQICAFSAMAFDLDDYLAAINSVTGWSWDENDLARTGERIFNLERRFDNFAGIEKDTLPRKFTVEQINVGRHAGRVCDIEPLLQEYYLQRGWNDGVVNSKKLEELQLA